MQRRRLLSVACGLLLAGCSALPGSGPATVTPSEPNDDGTATLGELRYLLEENDVEEYERLDVTSMTRDGDAIRLTYASEAEHAAQFVDEVGTVAALYGVYIENGGTTERIVVTVEPNYADQAERFHVTTEWIRSYNDGSLSGRELANRILSEAEYPTTGNESA